MVALLLSAVWPDARGSFAAVRALSPVLCTVPLGAGSAAVVCCLGHRAGGRLVRRHVARGRLAVICSRSGDLAIGVLGVLLGLWIYRIIEQSARARPR